MKIHTNLIEEAHLTRARTYAMEQAEQGAFWIADMEVQGSRTHGHKLVVHLEGDGSTSRRRRNSGTYGAVVGSFAATYDQWGWFLAYLFDIDPEARTDGRGYNGFDNYHEQTQGKYLLTTLLQTATLLAHWEQMVNMTGQGAGLIFPGFSPKTPMRIMRQEGSR